MEPFASEMREFASSTHPKAPADHVVEIPPSTTAATSTSPYLTTAGLLSVTVVLHGAAKFQGNVVMIGG